MLAAARRVEKRANSGGGKCDCTAYDNKWDKVTKMGRRDIYAIQIQY